KIADQTSDAILDAILADDPDGRVACEVLVTTGLCLVAGEITTSTYVDIPTVVRGTIRSIGYTDSSYGIDGETCAVLVSIGQQSPDIAQGVDPGGAGDQGMMFGYAVDETPELMPATVMFAPRLTQRGAAQVVARSGAAARECAQGGRAAVAAAGREGAGDPGVGARSAGARADRRREPPAPAGRRPRGAARCSPGAWHRGGAAGGAVR